MNGWTPERRKRQAALIHFWKPWRKAGVKTDAGKARSKMNALKQGMRGKAVRELKYLLSEQKKALKTLKPN
jgi:hypothetical protein